MKKIILSSLFVLAVSFTYSQKAEFGIKGGLNIANQNYSGDGAPSPSSIIGLLVSCRGFQILLLLQQKHMDLVQGACCGFRRDLPEMLFDQLFNLYLKGFRFEFVS